MKNIKYILSPALYLLMLSGLISCDESDYKSFDTSLSNIYFPNDSVFYSFGTTSLTVTSYTLKLPVKILGVPIKEKRTFQIELIQEKTNAKAGEQYILPSELTIEADSVNGIIPLEIMRNQLGEDRWQVGFRLITTPDFIPAKEVGDHIVATFNNIVEPPTWTDWQGKPAWPQERLGVWNPIVWLTFMEYFRKMETTVPVTYHKMVEQFGPDLENVTYSWPHDFDYSIRKYILIPMYDYFQQHPELKVDMPYPQIY